MRRVILLGRSLIPVLMFCMSAFVFSNQAPARDRVTECQRPTFGYGQPWVKPMAGPMVVGHVVGCPTCVYSAGTAYVSSGVVLDSSSEQSSVVGETFPLMVIEAPRTFRLCVSCPANAVVVVDGHVTKSTKAVREYELNLPITGPNQRPVTLMVLRPGKDVLWQGAITAYAGGSSTVVANPGSTMVLNSPSPHVLRNLEQIERGMKATDDKIRQLQEPSVKGE